jgi:magnesium chelatase family protein
MTHLASATLDGARARLVEVECSLIRGLPSFSIVGLGDNAIMESKERVKSALSKSKITIPPYKLIVNLSPADVKKSGSTFDMPIAVSIMCEVLKKKLTLKDAVFLGELGLDGALKHSNQIFPIALSLAKDASVKRFVVPKESAKYLSKITSCEVYAADTLLDVFELVTGEVQKPYSDISDIDAKTIEIEGIKYFFEQNFELDFEDVKGQHQAKRAAMIASAGMHNILLEGSPGCGKSMIMKRLRYIMPPASTEEVLKFAMLDFLDGKEAKFSPQRPMRNPHANTTRAALLGGGSKDGQMGEIALASGGVLWMDELPHFDKTVIEGLREPLENYRILISRVNSKIEYEADFLFAGSMNPCPCGNLLSKSKECRCKESEIQKYKNKLSEPFLDRVDIFVQMEEFEPNSKSTLTSPEMFEGVLKAFKMQKSRGTKFNSRLNERELRELAIDDDASSVLEQAVMRFGLSERAKAKTLKVARTVADIEEDTKIRKSHVLEALSFRKRY